MASSTDPATYLAKQGLRISAAQHQEPQRRRSVTDLITFMRCPRYAHHFSHERYPTHTPDAVRGQILHRTIKHLHGQYRAKQQAGQIDWLPGEDEVREECRNVEESTRAQGLPQLTSVQSDRLQRMLCSFHALEARTFYPRIKAAEVPLRWLWKEAPAGQVLLEGTVDVVLIEQAKGVEAVALWDYKTGKQPEAGDPQLRADRRQLQLYGFLYRQCYGVLPNQLALYFMGELDKKSVLTKRPTRALYELAPMDEDHDVTLEWLRQVLEQEEVCRQAGRWDAPESDRVPHALCRSCQVRWSCLSVKKPFPWEAGAEQEDGTDSDDL